MAQTNLIGKNILGYTVSEKLSSDTSGTMYRVIKTNAAGQYVRALKHITIPTEKQYSSVLNSMGGDVSKANSCFSEMFNSIVSEIRILNDLSEKGVQHVVGYYENDIIVTDSPRRYDIFILMEYLTSLEDFIQRKDFLVRDVVRLGLDTLYGLQSCHDNSVIHRNIKEKSIFVSDKGEYKIGNFGISTVLKDSSETESLKGIPNFLAPEVYFGKTSYTKSFDLYSLGILLYRLLNYSRNPFLPHFSEQYFAQDEDAAFEERMSGKAPALPVLGGEEIGHVIVKAISNSTERFKTADEFINALKLAINNTPSEILNEKIKAGIPSYVKPIGEANEPVVLNKKGINKFLFIIPVIILLVGVAAYFIVIPNIYEEDISYIGWLFTDPENIINILCDPNDVLFRVNSDIGIRIFLWIWLAGLITSLFFVGKQFQSKPEPNAANAILTKKEAYLMIRDVTEALKHLKARRSSKQLDSLMYAMKKLEEKLSVESDFRYGQSAVINCENNIARQIQFLLDTVSCIEDGDFEENLNAMNTAVMNISTLLRRRTELKKK